MMNAKRLLFFLLALLLASPAAAQALRSRAAVLAPAERLADWQLAHRESLDYIPRAGADTHRARDWQQAAFWIGMTALADRSSSPRFREAILATGRAEGWRLGDRPYHADDHAIGAVWLWAARHGAGPEAIAPMKALFDRDLAAPQTGSLTFTVPHGGDPECTTRWCWCDALFMAPPVWIGLSRETGDPRYAAFADREYRATTDLLFDKHEHLFFRDSRFIDQRGGHGEKLFWSRGNGWVFSGLARLIPELAQDDPRRAYYVTLFKTMAARIVTLQRPNGYWPPSLLSDPAKAADETSGTGFYVHGLAWGIRAGILPAARYQPAVVRGWEALLRAVQPDGRLGWVQQVSDRPDSVAAQDTQFYGTGAFLLAASAVADLAPERRASFAAATLNVKQGDHFVLTDHISVPADHKIHDDLIAFEGPGWESDRVAYRLYLDERNVPDIYGKRLPGRILDRIGQGHDDYHELADWGMDIFQVDQTLGMGGIGVMRDGKVTQLGPASISANVSNPGGGALVSVLNAGFAGRNGPATLSTVYSITPGSRVTQVTAKVTGAVPQMVAGLTLHPGVSILASHSGKWRYIATWGAQSLAHDALGIALFYPDTNVAEIGQNSGTYFVRFCDARRIRYAFAAAWVQEPGAPQTEAEFRRWLDTTAAQMSRTYTVPPGCKD